MPYPVDISKYPVTAAFGVPGKHWSSGRHPGVDQRCPIGTPVKAVQDGKVTGANWGRDYGLHLVIDQKAAIIAGKRVAGGWANYAHLSKKLVGPGKDVVKGMVIGLSGNSGNSTNPHIHYEIRNNIRWGAGTAQNPLPFLLRP